MLLQLSSCKDYTYRLQFYLAVKHTSLINNYISITLDGNIKSNLYLQGSNINYWMPLNMQVQLFTLLELKVSAYTMLNYVVQHLTIVFQGT